MKIEKKNQNFFSSAWLPNTITYLNLFSGFFAILFISEKMLTQAAWLIILALLCDSLDGNIARALKTTSAFGRQLDSLADMVSFVAAPAFLAYRSWAGEYLPWTISIVLFYLGAGTYRLARFNIRPRVRTFFEGLPSPAAGVLIAMSMIIYQRNEWSGFFEFILAHGILMIVLSVLMVSRIPYPKFSAGKFLKWQLYYYIGLAIFIFVSIACSIETAVASFLLLFVVFAPIFFFAFQTVQARKEILAGHHVK